MHDYLILGQGLAGSLLAWQLIQRGQRVLVLDDGHATSSSRVAAGLINPMAGMRFNAAPDTAEWLASLRSTYRAIAETLGSAPYLHEVPMQRLLRSARQRRFYERQRNNPAVAAYLGAPLAPGQADPGIRSPHGGFGQKATGFVDLPQLLDDLHDWLDKRHAVVRQHTRHQDIAIGQDGVHLGRHQARHLVCCEGYRMRDNPWFAELPLQPDKGELLRLRSGRTLCTHIINGANWLLPLGNGNYRFGATHEHHDIDCKPTAAGREALLDGLHRLLEDDSDIHIEEHAAGVRPATSDRQPLIGTHRSHSRLHLFNGFGARGALSIPWYSERMCDHLLEQHPLPPAADIGRFKQ